MLGGFIGRRTHQNNSYIRFMEAFVIYLLNITRNILKKEYFKVGHIIWLVLVSFMFCFQLITNGRTFQAYRSNSL